MRLLAGFALLAGAALAQVGITESIDLKGLKAAVADYKGRKAIELTEIAGGPADGGLCILKREQMQDGALEVWVAGEPGPGAGTAARGFVGVAFRVRPGGEKYEAFYLRPTNGRAEDQVRRNHSLQYISHPDHHWQRLRKEFPEKYESYADLVPGEWTKMRVEVKGRQARLFVNGTSQPNLIVNDLFLGEDGGGIALWVGPGTVARFADFVVVR
ncbi:MAG TPA: hypothetical protein VGK29_09780 [Paludibaculum sp.]|jgi:hypothetical protein